MEHKRILIVEDEVLIAEYLGDILRSAGCGQVYFAHNSKDAKAALDQSKFDLVLFDIRIDGEFAGIKLAEYTASEMNTPFIFLTANSDLKVMQKALGTGPAAFLTKPFRSTDVLAAISLALERRGGASINQRETVAESDKEGDYVLINGFKITKGHLSQFDVDRIRAINDGCERHFWDNTFKSDNLADELNISRRQLYRFMNNMLNTTPACYLKRFRLQKAYAYLKDGHYQRVKAVAYDVGFLKVSYFSQEFEKEFGIKPSDLQKETKQA